MAFKEYTHFTSPIRRYPDLIVHRLIKKYVSDGSGKVSSQLHKNLKSICEQSTKTERNAMEAERESVKLKQNEYISQHINEEFEGIISGVMSFGIFVELIDTLVEGLVHIQDMDDDYYIYDEKTYALIGRDTDKVFRLGDQVKIRVKKVNLEESKVDSLHDCEADGKILGLLGFRVRENLEEKSRFGEISAIVVHNDDRRQGIGRFMMDYAEELAKEDGCIGTWLVSGFGREEEAHQFYQQLGYQINGYRFVKLFK